jgi:hypothetical protein
LLTSTVCKFKNVSCKFSSNLNVSCHFKCLSICYFMSLQFKLFCFTSFSMFVNILFQFASFKTFLFCVTLLDGFFSF